MKEHYSEKLKNMNSKLKCLHKLILLIALICINFYSCSYSFTGSSVAKHLKTIFISAIDDKSGLGEPRLRDSFREKLIQKFSDDNTLKLADRNSSNLILECTITGVSDAPSAITAGESVASRKLNINVRIICKDMVMKKNYYDLTLTNFADYLTTGNVNENRKNAIDNAVDKITEDIVLKTVSNW